MSGARGRFTEVAQALGLRPDVHRFPEGTKTAEEAARDRLRHRADREVARVHGRRRARPGAHLGAEPRRHRAARLRLFGHSAPVRTFVDEDLPGFAEVSAAAGTPDGVFPLSPGDLVSFSRGVRAAFVESPPTG